MPPSLLTIIAGRHAVADFLERHPGLASELLIAGNASSPALARIREAARLAGVKVRSLTRKQLDGLVRNSNHQGVALKVAAQGYASWDFILKQAAEAGEEALVVMADHLQDPHNLGALMRSALAAGAQGMVVAKDRACPLTPAVAKTAAGAWGRLPVCRVTNLTTALKELKSAGLWALAAETRGGTVPWELDLRIPLVLVVGGEHKGVGRRLRAACDLGTTLPLAPGSESLNASVAAGVVLFEIVRQRNSS